MLVKINSRGSGGGRGPTEYLTGKFGTVDGKMPTAAQRVEGVGLRSVEPVVLRGDVEQTRELIDSLSFKQKYCSGVLSFEEPNALPEVKAEIMDSWESALFPGMEKDQYQILWVEHRDKGRLELNFLIPTVELDSGKRLQPYFDKADRKRIDAWQTITNDNHSLSDPKEPARAKLLSEPADLPKDAQEAKRTITRGLLAHEVESRADVIQALEGAGYEVSRQTKKSISVKLTPDAHPLRLSGAIYAETYRGGPALREECERAEEGYAESRKSRISEAEQRYKIGIDKRTEYLHGRYNRNEPAALALGDIERASIARGLPDRVRPDRVALPERQLHDDENLRLGRAIQGEVGAVLRPAKDDGKRRNPLYGAGVEHDGTRTDLAEFAESVGRRARKRTSENGLTTERNRGFTSLSDAAGKLGNAVNEVSERLGRAVDQLVIRTEEIGHSIRSAIQPAGARIREFMERNKLDGDKPKPTRGGPSMGR